MKRYQIDSCFPYNLSQKKKNRMKKTRAPGQINNNVTFVVFRQKQK